MLEKKTCRFDRKYINILIRRGEEQFAGNGRKDEIRRLIHRNEKIRTHNKKTGYKIS
jgi:hypothetical protein